MFGNKKKPGGPSVMIAAFGKPKKSDLESPEPVEGMRKPPKEMEYDESGGETDYGAKLIADIEAAGESLGMDAEQSRQAAGAFFSAAAECLLRSGENSGEENPKESEGGY